MELETEYQPTSREVINKVCRDYATVYKNIGFKGVFDKLYEEFKNTYGIDLVKETHEGNYKNKLECAERLDCIEKLEALAKKMFVIEEQFVKEDKHD